MTLDTTLGLAGAIFGLLGIVLAYVFYRKSVRTKILAIAYTEPIPLVMTFANISVAYEHSTISALSRVYVLLWNRGSAPIEGGDFISPIKFSSTEPILKLGIHDKDAAVMASMDSQGNSLNIALLRPGEAITLIAEVANLAYRPDIQVQMKSADMSTFIWGVRALYPNLAAAVVAISILLIEGLVSSRWISATQDSDRLFTTPFFEFMFALVVGMALLLIVAGFFPFLFAFLTQKIVAKTLARSTSPVAWNFFQMKIAGLSIRTKSKEFSRFVDTVIKKLTG